MAYDSMHILIAGAGIAGLSLAVFLEKAGMIQYTVLERSPVSRPLGSSITLSPQTLRVFDQVGILQEMRKVALPLDAIHYIHQDLKICGTIDGSNTEERQGSKLPGPLPHLSVPPPPPVPYGYKGLFFARPDLIDILLKQIPPEKIQWDKKIVETLQDDQGVQVRCADGTTLQGDILVGADGAYSAVRQSMYKNIQEQGRALNPSDVGPLRFDHYAMLGVTSDMRDLVPELDRKSTVMNVVLASPSKDFNVYVTPLPFGRIGWGIAGDLLATQIEDADSFLYSEWGSDSVKVLQKEIKDIKVPFGLTVGQLINRTSDLSRSLLEDKFFHTWFDQRTVLVGDAAHKVLPAGGQGANQAILDVICLANLLHELPSKQSSDIKIALEAYVESRAIEAKNAVDSSRSLNTLQVRKGFIMNMVRSIVFGLPDWMTRSSSDRVYGCRPILTFLDPIPLKGSVPDTSKFVTFAQKKERTAATSAMNGN
ncbi:hypothetical protein BGZ73_007314 [Actinomortierella ambigua]|nr:hypothetical protein BGZ73_007314 [Actinomortierella ambigua]